jgi:hypothetical protein
MRGPVTIVLGFADPVARSRVLLISAAESLFWWLVNGGGLSGDVCLSVGSPF